MPHNGDKQDVDMESSNNIVNENVSHIDDGKTHRMSVNTGTKRAHSTNMEEYIEELRAEIIYLRTKLENERLTKEVNETQNLIYTATTQNRFQNLETTDETTESAREEIEEDFFKVIARKNQKRKAETLNNKITKQPSKVPKGADVITRSHAEPSTSAAKERNEQKTIKQTKGERIPPINIQMQTQRETIIILKRHQIHDYEIKKINSNKHSIYAGNMETFKKIKETLKQVNTPYFTYTPKNDKNKTVLLKGLDKDEDIQELVDELKEHEGDNFKLINITKFYNDRKDITAAYLVQVSPDSSLMELYKITKLNHRRIRWEPLRKRNIMQCKNCQRFGHAAVNCQLGYRCVKCDRSHGPGECDAKKEENSIPYCSNCQAQGHPASYRGCPVYKKMISRIREIRENKKNNNNNNNKNYFDSNYVKEGLSYADILNRNNNSQRQNSTNNASNQQTIIQQKIMETLDSFKNYIIKNDKNIEMILNTLSALVNGD